MARTAQGEQAGNRGRKAARTQDFDRGMASFTGSVLPPHTHTHTLTVQYLYSQLAGLTGPDPRCRLFLPFSHPGTFLSVPASRGSVARERAGRDQRGASGGPHRHMDSLTVTGASEDLPFHDVCLCLCVSERWEWRGRPQFSPCCLCSGLCSFRKTVSIYPPEQRNDAQTPSSVVFPCSSVFSLNTLGTLYCPIK